MLSQYYTDTSASRNNGYWLSYRYFIVLEGESAPTNKLGRPDSGSLSDNYSKHIALAFIVITCGATMNLVGDLMLPIIGFF